MFEAAITVAYYIDPVFAEMWLTHGKASDAHVKVRKQFEELYRFKGYASSIRLHPDTKLYIIVVNDSGGLVVGYVDIIREAK